MFIIGLIELCSQTHGGDYDCPLTGDITRGGGGAGGTPISP